MQSTMPMTAKPACILALTEPYDAAVIDIMLPKLDGLSLIEQMRQKKIATPVIILSAKDSVDDRVKGLQTGQRRLSDEALRLFRAACPGAGI